MREFISRFLLWAVVPQNKKSCSSFCLRCPFYDQCVVEVRDNLQILNRGYI